MLRPPASRLWSRVTVYGWSPGIESSFATSLSLSGTLGGLQLAGSVHAPPLTPMKVSVSVPPGPSVALARDALSRPIRPATSTRSNRRERKPEPDTVRLESMAFSERGSAATAMGGGAESPSPRGEHTRAVKVQNPAALGDPAPRRSEARPGSSLRQDKFLVAARMQSGSQRLGLELPGVAGSRASSS